MAKMTTAQQIGFMEEISQSPAAWACGISPRALRDAVGLDRNEDGSYSVQSLIEWASRRVGEHVTLSNSEYEKLLVLCGALRLECDSQQTAALKVLEELRNKHGDAAFVCFVDLIMQEWRTAVEFEDDFAVDPDAERRAAEYARQVAQDQEAESELRIVVQCDCGRVRRGRKWIMTNVPPEHKVTHDMCPKCTD